MLFLRVMTQFKDLSLRANGKEGGGLQFSKRLNFFGGGVNYFENA